MSYDNTWHQMYGDMTSASARHVLGALREALLLETALDVGCGDGRWLEVWCELGGSEVTGVDGPWNDTSALRFSKDNFVVKDLSVRFDLGKRFDVVMSLEVAEHIPPESSEGFVETLTRHGDCVLFGAAIPYQGGYRHINERWQSYWAGLFEARGFIAIDPFRPIIWDKDDVHYWYKQNTLLYISRDREDMKAAIVEWMASHSVHGFPVKMVHPDRYESIASYTHIAFKPLLKRLPGRVWRKAVQVIGRKS